MTTIHNLVQDAIEEFKNSLSEVEYVSEGEIYDLIHEIADSHITVYNSELLEVAMSNLWLATSEPEL